MELEKSRNIFQYHLEAYCTHLYYHTDVVAQGMVDRMSCRGAALPNLARSPVLPVAPSKSRIFPSRTLHMPNIIDHRSNQRHRKPQALL